MSEQKWTHLIHIKGLPFSTFAPRGGGGFKSPIHFHAKRGGGGPDSMYNCVRTKHYSQKK